MAIGRQQAQKLQELQSASSSASYGEDFYSDVDEYFAELMIMKNKTWVTQMKYRDMFHDYVQ